jgi:hypothetical protein
MATIFKGWKIVSADHFFTLPDGSYKFDPKKLQLAHDTCYNNCKRFLAAGYNVIVDNTNRKISEFQRYLDIKNVDRRVYYVDSLYENTKNLPNHVIKRFFNEYETYEGERYAVLNKETGKITFNDIRMTTHC